MWLYLTDSFLSIVQDRDYPEQLHVRARFAGDIQRAFGEALARRRNTQAQMIRQQIVAAIGEQVKEGGAA